MADPKMTSEDIGWTLLFMFVFLVSLIGCISVAIIYVIPNFLEYPNVLPRKRNDGIIEFGVIALAFLFGTLLFPVLFCYLSRDFVSNKTRKRWQLQFENGSHKIPIISRFGGKYFLKIMIANGDK